MFLKICVNRFYYLNFRIVNGIFQSICYKKGGVRPDRIKNFNLGLSWQLIGPGRSHMPGQLSLCTSTTKAVPESPRAATTGAHAPQ